MIEKLLDEYPQGSDIILMNTIYAFPRRNDETDSWDPDFLIIVYKDNTTGEKKHITIKKPKYRFYYLPEQYPAEHNELFMDADKLEPIEVEYRKVEREIARLTGQEDEFKEWVSEGMKEEIRNLHTHPRIFNSDQNIEDHYRLEFSKYYQNRITKLHKAFYDIEVDTKYINGDFPEPETAECPINAISLYDDKENVEYSFLLRDRNNPLIAKFEEEYQSKQFSPDDIYKFVEKSVGGWKQMKRNKLDETSFRLYWFDSEIELLTAFFHTVYKFDPDFIMGWNSSAFDLSYILHRIAVLGYNVEDIVCDPRWEIKYIKHYVDERNIDDFAERGDYTAITCNTVWIDQMIQFCSRRKAKMGSFTSFKLDDIGEVTAGVHKLDYSHITTNLSELPWLDYKTFVLYNVMDVVVQRCIENKAQDLEYLFAKCIVNNTVYRKGHRQTVYLINRMTTEWEKLGYIIGNNINKKNPEPGKFQGALVGEPMNTSDYSKIKINGTPIMVCDNLQDYDFKSLYPSIMLEFNIAPNTQIGRIDIWNIWRVNYIIHDPNQGDIKKEYYVRDVVNAKEYPQDLDSKGRVKGWKKVQLYNDRTYRDFVAEVEYNPNNFETLEYEKIYDQENFYANDKYSRSGEFIENLVSDNLIEFSKRWLHLAGFKEFMEDWDEYNKKTKTDFSGQGYYGFYSFQDGKLRIAPVKDVGVGTKRKAIRFNEPKTRRPIFLYGDSKFYGVDTNEYNTGTV